MTNHATQTTHITLAGNFRPEWKQLLDAVGDVTHVDYDPANDAAAADAAREFVQAVLELSESK
jgi:hypothetical protein